MTAVAARDFIRMLIDRARSHEPGMVTVERQAHLTIDEARLVWRAAKWLEVIAEGPVENTDFSIQHCRQYLMLKVEEMKAQEGDEKILNQDRRGMVIMEDVERHLDNWVLAREFDELKKARGESSASRSNGKRKR